MKRTIVFALLFTMYCCVAVSAQTFSLLANPEPVTSLDGLWRFHEGDNPAWASPDYDDSQWPLIRSDESWTKQGVPAFDGYAWYRFQVEVPGNGQPVDLLLTYIVNGYQVYADGELIGSAGSSVPTDDPALAARPAVFPLPVGDSGPQTIQIAVRVWNEWTIARWYGAGTWTGGSEIGSPALLLNKLQLLHSDQAVHYVNAYGTGLFAALAGLVILVLFLLHREDKEYFWFSVLLLAGAAEIALDLTVNLASFPFPLWRLLALIADATSVIAALMFFSIVLPARRSKLWRAVAVVAAIAPLTAAPIYFDWAETGTAFAMSAACLVPAYAWIVVSLLLAAKRKASSARQLLAPVLLFYGIGLINYIGLIASAVSGSQNIPTLNAFLFSRPFPLQLSDVINYFFVLALLIFLVRRFALARREEARLAAESAAAKSVQSLLIPATPAATPGFRIENAYLPAKELGGDFFHVQPGSDGSLRIVVGDVSSKGLKAAMTVSAIVGTMRGCTLRAPAEVLSYLNETLRGEGSGFVTCCAVLVEADGKLTIANAGHVPPLLNGEGLATSPGLPLGVASGIAYTEATYALGPNDRLTFVSDGVVEARNAKGEPFGLECLRGIIEQTAGTIAEMVREYGQTDDITVLKVARAV